MSPPQPGSSFETPTSRTRPSRLSIASRLMSFVNPNNDPTTSQTSYNRLRDQLFPTQPRNNRLPPDNESNQMSASSDTTIPMNTRRITESLYRRNRERENAALHPSFRSKAVCVLDCTYCKNDICNRGMKAILLADTSVELYSTDDVTRGGVQLVGEDYITRNCRCRIRDVACLGCGNVVGCNYD
jgi:hypothetical protein